MKNEIANEKREIILLGIIGSVLSLLVCWLGLWLLSQEGPGITNTYSAFGISIEGKALAGILTFSGLVALFFRIRNTMKRLSEVKKQLTS